MDPDAPGTSQHGEDVLVAKHFDDKHGGFFVEVGALDGVTLSNTYLLERNYGWTGVLIEADPVQAARCAAARPSSTTVARAATSPGGAGRTIELTVVSGEEALSTLRLTDRTERLIESARRTGKHVALEGRTVATATLDQILTDAGAPSHIDFLSIDIEGHEAEALSGLSLGSLWSCGVVLTENNRLRPDYRVWRQLAHANYRYVKTVAHINDWYEPSNNLGVLVGFLTLHVASLRTVSRESSVRFLRRLGLHDTARSLKNSLKNATKGRRE